jgi:putative endonuclease
MDLQHLPPRDRGRDAEERACRLLQARGLTLITRNYRCRHGEIDLVMRDSAATVFVEVRYRGNRRFAGGAESVDHRKRARLIAAALHYLQRHPEAAARPARFDVIAAAPGSGEDSLQWIRDAFGLDS